MTLQSKLNFDSFLFPLQLGAWVRICWLLLIALNCHAAEAQTWQVNNPEVYEPVPQYTPNRYPLNSQPPQPPAIAPAVTQPPTTSPPESALIETNAVHIRPLDTNVAKTPAAKKAEDPRSKKTSHGNRVNWDIYRDRNVTPIDPRKPCNVCTHPAVTHPRCDCKIPGINGRPYLEKEPGGCKCATKHPMKHPEFSVHWPRPFSAKLDARNPAQAETHYSDCPQKRIVDVFDPLSTFKISNYKRKDNGYCGPGSDPYGCVGESKARRVAGVGYRFPSEPVPRGSAPLFNQ